MTESHQPPIAFLHRLDEAGYVALRSDFIEHHEDSFIGAAMERTVECRGSSCHRGERIDVRAPDTAHRIRTAILLVVGVQYKKHVERVLEHGIHLVLDLGHLEKHVQKTAGVAHFIVGIHIWPADAVPVGERRECRHFSHEPVDLELS